MWMRIDRVRRPLEAPYAGPYKVLQRASNYFLLEISDNVHTNVSIDRLKPYVENCTPTPIEKPVENSESLSIQNLRVI